MVEEEVTVEAEEESKEYDLDIKVPAEMRSVLRNAAGLAYTRGDIPKPDLVDLMNLFIRCGQVQKEKMAGPHGLQVVLL